jgi:Trypsin-like peptidase domain
MSNNPDQPSAKSTASAAVQLNEASFRSVRIEMVFCPDGPDTDATTAVGCNGMADASAFIYRLDDKHHLVTARHNVTGRHWQTNDFLSDRFTVEPTHLRVLFFANSPEQWTVSPLAGNPRAANLQVLFRQHLVPLIGEDWRPIWTQHPQLGGDMDVAVVPFNPPADTMIRSWGPTPPRTGPEEAPWPQLSPGQDVFIIGYPYKLIVGPLLPLWIRGTVASDPPFGYQAAGKTYPLFLIDARTRPGNSGAPVMRYRPPGTYVMRTNKTPGVTIGSDSDLVGVYSGRTRDESDLGFVWVMDEVDEICRNSVQGTVP